MEVINLLRPYPHLTLYIRNFDHYSGFLWTAPELTFIFDLPFFEHLSPHHSALLLREVQAILKRDFGG